MNNIIIIVVSFVVGFFVSWLYLIKIKKPKATNEAIEGLGASKESDKDRERIKKEILEQIKRNEEIRNKIKEKLNG